MAGAPERAARALLVQRLLEVTGGADEAAAERALARAEWDLERAVEEALSGAGSGAAAERGGAGGVRRRGRAGGEGGAATVENGGAAPGVGAAAGPRSGGPRAGEPEAWSVLGAVGSVVLYPMRVLTGVNGDIDASAAAEVFARDFARCTPSRPAPGSTPSSSSRPEEEEEEEGEDCVRFACSSYLEALQRASRSSKLLLVYLHSAMHPDAAPYCIEVLCAPHVARLVNRSMVAWGGCVEHAEAYQLSTLFNTATYPYVAVLEPPADPRQSVAKLVDCVEGASGGAAALLAALTRANDAHGSVVAERAAQRYETAERERLRREQDEALQAAMEEDSRREAERARRQLEQHNERAAVERVERERAAAEQARARALESKRAALGPEPEAAKGGATTTVRFQLPCGARFQRVFRSSDTLGSLRDYVFVELADRGKPITNYAVALNFPKKTFGPEADLAQSLKDCDMVPQAVLFIQDLDS
jgi:hypothetical protein